MIGSALKTVCLSIKSIVVEMFFNGVEVYQGLNLNLF